MCTGAEGFMERHADKEILAGGVMDAVGKLTGAVSTRAAANYQADQLEADARATVGLAGVAGDKMRRAGAQTRKSARAAYGASGVAVDSGSALAVQEDARRLGTGLLRGGRLGLHHRGQTVEAVEAADIGLGDPGQLLGARAVAHGHDGRFSPRLETENGALRQRQLGTHQAQQAFGHGMGLGLAQAGQQRAHLRQRQAARRGARWWQDPVRAHGPHCTAARRVPCSTDGSGCRAAVTNPPARSASKRTVHPVTALTVPTRM